MSDGFVMNDQIMTGLEQLRDHLLEHDPRRVMNINTSAYTVQLSSEKDISQPNSTFDPVSDHERLTHHEAEIVHFERMPSVLELLEFMAEVPLKDQIYMICNLLTISGYTQREIAETLGIAHKSYRNRLADIRKELHKKGMGNF